MARGYFLPSITCPALKKISPPRGLESSAQQLEKIISQFFGEKIFKKYFIAEITGVPCHNDNLFWVFDKKQKMMWIFTFVLSPHGFEMDQHFFLLSAVNFRNIPPKS